MSSGTFADLFRTFYGVLEALEIEYFAYGGVAVAVWGDPRETVDVDAVVCVADEDLDGVVDALATAGFTCPAEARTTFAVDGWLRLRFRRRHADLALGRTPFDRSALSRRRRVKLLGSEIWVVSAEDLILYKLVSYRYKDLGDAEAVIVRLRGKLDLQYLRTWAAEIAARTGKFEVPGKLEEFLVRVGC